MVNVTTKKPSDYVLGTGKMHSVKDFAKLAFSIVGLDYRKYVKFNKALLRPAEVETLKANYNKAKKVLKWKPSINFNQLVKEMVEADLKFLNNFLVNKYLIFRTDRIGDFLVSAILIKSIKKMI